MEHWFKPGRKWAVRSCWLHSTGKTCRAVWVSGLPYEFPGHPTQWVCLN